MTDSNSNEMKRKPSFSIDDILSPNFGNVSTRISGTSKLSKPKNDSGNSGNRVKNNAAADLKSVPAWIFCTRYSDRPASGNTSLTFPEWMASTAKIHFYYKKNSGLYLKYRVVQHKSSWTILRLFVTQHRGLLV